MSTNFNDPLLLAHITENGRHMGICKNAGGLCNMCIVPMVHSTLWHISQDGPFIISIF